MNVHSEVYMSPNPTMTMAVKTAPDGTLERRALSYRVTRGPLAGATGDVTNGEAIVGRAVTSDLRIDDPTVSQFHVELRATEAGIELRDLGSRNGTAVGGLSIFNARVPDGTEIVIGDSAIVVSVGPAYRAELSKATSFGGLVGASPAMRELYAILGRLARTDVAIVIEGESGVGKSAAARAIHDASRRAQGPFVVVPCSALSPTLAAGLLFGDEESEGALVAASGGTLVLDEVCELPIDIQLRLAEVLGARALPRTSRSGAKQLDVRVLSTSTRRVRELVNAGGMSENLYARVAQSLVRVPSLAERREDVRPLALHFLSTLPWDVQAARAMANDALDAIATRAFPGNVRELRAIVERTAMLADGPQVSLADVTFERLVAADRESSEHLPGIEASSPLAKTPDTMTELEPFKEAKRTIVDEFERGYLARLLARAGTNVSRAASLAGIERQTLRDLMRRHGLRGDD